MRQDVVDCGNGRLIQGEAKDDTATSDEQIDNLCCHTYHVKGCLGDSKETYLVGMESKTPSVIGILAHLLLLTVAAAIHAMQVHLESQ